MKDYSLYQKANLPDHDFPARVFRVHLDHQQQENDFPNHWHESIEFLYFDNGEAVIECNSKPVPVSMGDLIVVNSNELHGLRSASEKTSYYCIIIDPQLLNSSFFDACDFKYITPIEKNLILFKNKISDDEQVIECIRTIIREYEAQKTGYELAIKAFIYWLLVLLLRSHVQRILSPHEYEERIKNLARLKNVLMYIGEHFLDKLTIDQLAHIASLSKSHFCYVFKKVTNRTLSDYVNHLRVNKAEYLLKTTDMNITEIALATGFNDINYFSRLFKEYKNESPRSVRKQTLI